MGSLGKSCDDARKWVGSQGQRRKGKSLEVGGNSRAGTKKGRLRTLLEVGGKSRIGA